jgi:hypothetical protein
MELFMVLDRLKARREASYTIDPRSLGRAPGTIWQYQEAVMRVIVEVVVQIFWLSSVIMKQRENNEVDQSRILQETAALEDLQGKRGYINRQEAVTRFL